jgi:hypothetical protein
MPLKAGIRVTFRNSSQYMRDIPGEIEFEVVIKRRIPGVGRRGEKQRMAIRHRASTRHRAGLKASCLGSP